MSRFAPPHAEPRLLVVAQSPLSRAGLSALLEERGCQALAQSDGANLQADIDRLQPDVIVVDLGWGGDAMRGRLRQVEADVCLLALVDAEDPSAALLPVALRFSPFALLARDVDPDQIVAALEACASGLCVIDARLAPALAQPTQPEPALNPLTARENEVLQLLARGWTNRAIGLELGITQHTVKFHVNAIMGKLDAQSRTEAVVRATRLGMIVL